MVNVQTRNAAWNSDTLQKALVREQETRMSVQRWVNKESAKVHQKLLELCFEEKQLKGGICSATVGCPDTRPSILKITCIFHSRRE